jgi:N-acyl-L-homoserine lactone synthetase
MQVTTLSFGNMHNHGDLFANMFRARHETFIQHAKWDLPEADGMEFDQYDTPASRWIAVHEFGHVLPGVRLTPTTARCGIYTYMIRDAQRGLLESIPSNLLYDEAPVAPHLGILAHLRVARRAREPPDAGADEPHRSEMCRAARALGATSVLGLIPENGPRWGRRVGLDIVVAGPVLEFRRHDASRCIRINLATKMH